MCLTFIISDDVAKTMLSKLANFQFGMRIWEKVKVLCQWVGCGSGINKERMMSCVGTRTTLVAPTYLIHKHIKLKEKLHFFWKKRNSHVGLCRDQWLSMRFCCVTYIHNFCFWKSHDFKRHFVTWIWTQRVHTRHDRFPINMFTICWSFSIAR